MKKLILISLITISSSLFGGADIGVRIQTPIGNGGILDIGIRSDDHRLDGRYRNFDYHRSGYYDDYGYYFGYFDRIGYFYNNIFFTYDNRYTYYDRLHRRGYFKPSHTHFREYKYHKNNDWNRTHQYREHNQPIYGPYYEKNHGPKAGIRQNDNRNNFNQRSYKDQKNNRNEKNYRNDYKQENKNRNREQNNYREQKNPQIIEEYKNHR